MASSFFSFYSTPHKADASMPDEANHNIPSINVSPLPATLDAGSIPPSPTLSSHSVTPYKSTVQLRDNNPDQKSGLTSLGLLNPNTHSQKVNEKSLDVGIGEADQDGKKKKKKKKGKGKDEEPTQTNHQLELAQDEAINHKPFHFKPYQLAHMLDPKSLETLTAMHGITSPLSRRKILRSRTRAKPLSTQANSALVLRRANNAHPKNPPPILARRRPRIRSMLFATMSRQRSEPSL